MPAAPMPAATMAVRTSTPSSTSNRVLPAGNADISTALSRRPPIIFIQRTSVSIVPAMISAASGSLFTEAIMARCMGSRAAKAAMPMVSRGRSGTICLAVRKISTITPAPSALQEYDVIRREQIELYSRLVSEAGIKAK